MYTTDCSVYSIWSKVRAKYKVLFTKLIWGGAETGRAQLAPSTPIASPGLTKDGFFFDPQRGMRPTHYAK